MEEIRISVPPGYIVLSRAAYDDIVEQRVANRLDHMDTVRELEDDADRWHNMYRSAAAETEKAVAALEAANKREADLAAKLRDANELILGLRKENCLLNEELCRTDNIEEWKNGVLRS